MIRLLGCLVLGSLWTTKVVSQVIVGPVTLTLGESRAAVLKKLGAEYRLDSTTATPESDQWFVWERGGPPFLVAASIGFTGGRLTFISRAWQPAASDKGTVLRAAVRALSQLAGRPGQSCDVSSSRSSEPNSETELVTVTCGGHSVTISVGSVGTDLSSGINETWRLRR